jgi:hypothetical protein
VPVWKLLFVAAIVAISLFATYAALVVYRGIDDAYALWGAGDMVIEYMESHGGAWPRKWDDLTREFDNGNGRVGGWTFAEYQSRIRIDFAADPEKLRQESLGQSAPTFKAIWPAWDLGDRLIDPNEMLYQYFRRSAQPRGGEGSGRPRDGASPPPSPIPSDAAAIPH